MAKGAKTGGRKAGTPNKVSNRLTIMSMLEQMGINPIEGLAAIATDESHPIAVRRAAYSDLASYAHPQLKAVEHSGHLGITPNAGTESKRERILARLREPAPTPITNGSVGGTQ